MRLTETQRLIIQRTAKECFGENVQVWLFGSRVDERRRGGDIDLLVRPGRSVTGNIFPCKIRFLARLERLLGERKVDVVVEQPNDPRPIVKVAHETGVPL